MRLLSSFHNSHHNKPIVVCGCESLSEFVRPENVITIGVNVFGHKFQLDYLPVVSSKNQFSGERFVKFSQTEYLFSQLDLSLKHLNVVKFQIGSYAGINFSNPNVLH